MKYWLMVLFTPSCWLQLNRYSKAWDVKLNADVTGLAPRKDDK